MPVASAAASPPLEPLGVRYWSHGSRSLPRVRCRRASGSEVGTVGVADGDRAGGPEPLDVRGVSTRIGARQHPGTLRGGRPGEVDVVFPVKGTPWNSGRSAPPAPVRSAAVHACTPCLPATVPDGAHRGGHRERTKRAGDPVHRVLGGWLLVQRHRIQIQVDCCRPQLRVPGEQDTGPCRCRTGKGSIRKAYGSWPSSG